MFNKRSIFKGRGRNPPKYIVNEIIFRLLKDSFLDISRGRAGGSNSAVTGEVVTYLSIPSK